MLMQNSVYIGGLNIANERLDRIEKWQECFKETVEADVQKEHERLSEQGRKGVEVREDNRAMRQAATQEGRALFGSVSFPAILTDSAMQARAKAGLQALTLKYPKVAEEVFDRLCGEFNIGEPFYGTLKQIVAQTLLAPPQGENGPGDNEGWL